MSFATNQNPNSKIIEIPTGPGVNGSDTSNGSLTQGGSGPTALAMQILYQVMALYAAITGYNAKQQTTEIMAQQGESHAEAQAIKWAGIAIGTAMITGAVVGGLLAVGGFAAGKGYGDKEIAGDQEKLATLDAKMKEPSQISSLADDVDPEALSGEPEDDEDEKTDPVRDRKTDLEKGVFSSPEGKYTEQDTKKALAAMKHEKNGKFSEMRAKLEDKLNTLSKEKSTTVTRLQQRRQEYQNNFQFINGFRSETGSIAQGGGQLAQAKENAKSSLYRTAGSIAQQTASSTAEAKSKSGDAQNAVINTLNAMRQASASGASRG